MPLSPSSSQPRILHFRRVYSVASESFIYEPIRAMRQRGVDTRILTLVRLPECQPKGGCQFLITMPGIFWSGRMIRHGANACFRVSQPDALIWPMIKPLLLKQVRALQPDVIIAHFGPDGCLIAPIAARLGIPLIVKFYGYDVSRLLTRDRRTWRRRYAPLFARAARIVSISEHIQAKLISLGAPEEKLRIVRPGIRMDRFAPVDAGREDATIECLHVGRLVEKKAPLVTIRAFAQARNLTSQGHRLRLTLIGEGELEYRCRRLIAEHNLQAVVTMAGAVPHTDIPAAMARSHIYTQHCVTARDGDMEGLGISFAEASATGLPVVASRHNGVPEVVLDGKTGLLTDEHAVEATAAHIAALADNPGRRRSMGQAGRAHIERNYEINNSLDAMLALIDEIRQGETCRNGHREAAAARSSQPQQAHLS